MSAAGIATGTAAAVAPSRLLLPYQQRLALDESPMRLVDMSRRIGKDWTLAWEAVAKRAKGWVDRNLLHTAHREGSAREFITYVNAFAHQLDLVAEHAIGEELIGADNIRVMSVAIPIPGRAKPARIMSLSGNPDAVRGFQGDVILNEFAFRKDAAAAFKAATPLLMWGGQLTIPSTWKGSKNLWAEYVGMALRHANGEARPGDLKFSHHRVTLQDAVNDGLVERINEMTGQTMTREEFIADCRSKCRTESDWLEEFCCTAGADEESYFPYELLRQVVHADDPKPVQTLAAFLSDIARRCAALDATELCAGCDIGRVSDLFVLRVRAKVGGVLRVVGTLHFTGRPFGEMEACITTLLRAEFKTAKKDAAPVRVRRLCIDASGLGMQLAERMTERFRHRVEGVVFTATVKEELATAARRNLDEKTVTLEDDALTLGHWNAVRRIVTAAGNTRYDGETDTGHADIFWADALSIHAAESYRSPARVVKLKGGVW